MTLPLLAVAAGLALPAGAMAPPSSAVSIAPRTSLVGFGSVSGDGLGISILSRRIERESLRSGSSAAPNPDRQRQLSWRSTLLLDYRVARRTTLILAVPHVYNSAASDVLPRQTVNSLGDIALYGKYAFYQDRSVRPTRELSGLAGVKLPSGSAELRDAAGNRLDAPLQPGSGSTDFIVGAAASWGLPLATVYGDFTYKYNTRTAYTFGDSWGGNLGAAAPLKPAPWLSLTGEVNVESYERDHSLEAGSAAVLPGGAVRDTGGQYVFLTPGILVRPMKGLAVSLGVQLPVYQHLNGTQLASGPNLNLGLYTRLGGR
ncbi:MAG: hypothetical protein HY926_07880 [Elusimicrobia bacterium]|nr:hypothetical protein [Elusimicrobiota bacterium]